MKVRWFLRGMGVGIVLTALILCITYRGTQKDSNIIKQAKELGMQFPESETGDVSQAVKEMEEPLSQQTKKSKRDTVSGAAVKEESEADKAAREKLDKSSSDISNASKYNSGIKSFTIRSGLLSSTVAREMQEAGIIDDADAFDEYIEKNGYGKQLRSGKYKIPVGADYATIAKIITRQN